MRIFSRILTARAVTLVAFETLLIVGAIATAVFIRFGSRGAEVMTANDWLFKFLLVAAILQACLYYADLYDVRTLGDRRELFVRLVQALGAASFVLAGVYYWFPGLVIGRGVIAVAALLMLTLVPGWRLLFEWLSRNVRARERLLLVGTNAAAVELARELFDLRHDLGVEIVGFV